MKKKKKKYECEACQDSIEKVAENDREKMLLYGWITHYVIDDNNAHTHGLLENFSHLDIQCVIRLQPEIMHSVFCCIIERVKNGETFKPDILYDRIVKDYKVKFIYATEIGRSVLRLILPDPEGKLDIQEINEQFKIQYTI